MTNSKERPRLNARDELFQPGDTILDKDVPDASPEQREEPPVQCGCH